MTELKAARLAARLEQLKTAIEDLAPELEMQTAPTWLKVPYRFPEEPTLETLTQTLNEAIEWHTECDIRCAYGTYPMILNTCFWIAMARLNTNQIHGLCVLLNRLYHEALGKWG